MKATAFAKAKIPKLCYYGWFAVALLYLVSIIFMFIGIYQSLNFPKIGMKFANSQATNIYSIIENTAKAGDEIVNAIFGTESNII
jgi:uncharacterized membrane protein